MILPTEVPFAANQAGLPTRKQGGGCHGETVGHVRASVDTRSGNKSSTEMDH